MSNLHSHDREVILVTGSSNGIGRLTVETLARRGHTVYASMRDAANRNAAVRAELLHLAKVEGLDLHVIDLEVTDDASVVERWPQSSKTPDASTCWSTMPALRMTDM